MIRILRPWCAIPALLLLCLYLGHPAGATPVDLGSYNNASIHSRATTNPQPLCGNRHPDALCAADQPACNGIILGPESDGSMSPTCGHDDIYTGARCITFFSDKPTSCQNLDACVNFETDFTGSKNFSESDWEVEASVQQMRLADEGIQFVLTPDISAVNLRSKRSVVYGTITTVMKAGDLDGLVSAHTMMSASGDEIDWEYPGTNPLELNWWSGATMRPNPQKAEVSSGSGIKNDNEFHTLVLDWQPGSMTFSVGDADGKNMKQIWKKTNDTVTCHECFLPRTPSYVYLNYWNAGKNSWASGPPDWSKATNNEAYMTIKSVKVECYKGADALIKGSGNQYQWLTNITDALPPQAVDGKTVSVADFQLVNGDDDESSSQGSSSDDSTSSKGGDGTTTSVKSDGNGSTSVKSDGNGSTSVKSGGNGSTSVKSGGNGSTSVKSGGNGGSSTGCDTGASGSPTAVATSGPSSTPNERITKPGQEADEETSS